MYICTHLGQQLTFEKRVLTNIYKHEPQLQQSEFLFSLSFLKKKNCFYTHSRLSVKRREKNLLGLCTLNLQFHHHMQRLLTFYQQQSRFREYCERYRFLQTRLDRFLRDAYFGEEQPEAHTENHIDREIERERDAKSAKLFFS